MSIVILANSVVSLTTLARRAGGWLAGQKRQAGRPLQQSGAWEVW